MHLVLASASPRRVELLRAAGIDFDSCPVAIDESMRPGEPAPDYVRRLARAKAEAAVASAGEEAVVLGADTVVVLDGACFGKPHADEVAMAMLEQLSGRTHEVLTGVAFIHGGGTTIDLAATRVTFHALAPEEIAWYVATGEPLDKAGAYGIQGGASRFVASIDGSYSNVVGLPVELVYRHLRGLGLLGPTAPSDAR